MLPRETWALFPKKEQRRLDKHITALNQAAPYENVKRLLSRVQLSVTLWTVARQAPLSMEFSRHEYWSG